MESSIVVMRYRKPSIKSFLGVTKAKKKMKRNIGISNITKHTNISKNVTRTVKRNSGYYSGPMKLIRFLMRLFK